MFGLYIHIPFCKQKCLYCDFNSYAGLDNIFDLYCQVLCSEIKLAESNYPDDLEVTSIYFGGGTPSILSLNALELILKSCFDSFKVKEDVEITIEANPETLDLTKLKSLRRLGFNRLSIGFQTLNPHFLKVLERKHSAREALESYFQARNANFSNTNIDLIYGIPGQSLKSWKKDLKKVVELDPDHISAYSLEVHPETSLAEKIRSGVLCKINEDLQADIYILTCQYLSSAGIRQYEISNFSQPGFECRHNLTYWRNENYLGFGAGAHSHFSNLRFSNALSPQKYISLMQTERCAVEERIKLTIEDEIKETIFLNLRLVKGLKNKEFKKRFGKDLNLLCKKQIEKLTKLGFVSMGKTLKLTPGGRLLANQVFSEFV